MSTITDIKAVLTALLPSSQRIKIDAHREANNTIIDHMYDYMYIPFGVPFPYLGHTIPSNCHKCDGSLLNIEEYPVLYSEIGNTYNLLAPSGTTQGDGITTFNLPYIQPGGSVIQSGTDSTTGIIFTLGQSSASNGVDINTLITGEVKHKLTGKESGMPETDLGHYSLSATGNENREGIFQSTSTPRFVIPEKDAELAHNNMPPFIVGNWIMRLK